MARPPALFAAHAVPSRRPAGRRDRNRLLARIANSVVWPRHSAAAMLVLATSLLACTAGAANSDEVVSNLGQADGGSTSLKQFDQAQAFTTASNSNGYTLTSVETDFDMSRLGVWGADSVLTVGIWTDSSGSPGSSRGSLTSSTSGLSSGIHEFTTSGIDLDANTQYFIVVDVTDSNSCEYATDNPVTCRQRIDSADHIQDTGSDAEDSGAASGWSIHDQSLSRAWDSTGGWRVSASIATMNKSLPIVSQRG